MERQIIPSGSNLKLRGKVALVTGAAKGIGRAVTEVFLEEGAVMVLVDIDKRSLNKTVMELNQKSYDIDFMISDVTSSEKVDEVITRTVRKKGAIDILFNGAGVLGETPGFFETAPEEWEHVFSVNAAGCFYYLQKVGLHMRERGKGSIINVSSIAGKEGRTSFIPYGASKAVVINLTWSAALVLAPYGVRVNAICPGPVETGMWDKVDRIMTRKKGSPEKTAKKERIKQIPLGRMASPSDIAETALFLASDSSSFITGQTINVCGGLHPS